jgi:hypothetical protein
MGLPTICGGRGWTKVNGSITVEIREYIESVRLNNMPNPMKSFRVYLMSIAVCCVCVLSGCATTNQESSSATTGIDKLEQRNQSSASDMNWAEKTAFYFGWFSLYALYAYAGGNPAYSPPP